MKVTKEIIEKTHKEFDSALFKGICCGPKPPCDKQRRAGFRMRTLANLRAEFPDNGPLQGVLAALGTNQASPLGLFKVGVAIHGALKTVSDGAATALKRLIRVGGEFSRNFVKFEPDVTAAQFTFRINRGSKTASVRSKVFDLREGLFENCFPKTELVGLCASNCPSEPPTLPVFGIELKGGTVVDGRPASVAVSMVLTIEGIAVWEETRTGTAGDIFRERIRTTTRPPRSWASNYVQRAHDSCQCMVLFCHSTLAFHGEVRTTAKKFTPAALARMAASGKSYGPVAGTEARASRFDVDWIGVSIPRDGMRRMAAHAAWELEQAIPAPATDARRRFVLLLRSHENYRGSDGRIKLAIRGRLRAIAFELLEPQDAGISTAPIGPWIVRPLCAALGAAGVADNIAPDKMRRVFGPWA
jgi:hypothetical protein